MQTNSDLVSGEIKPATEEPVAWMYPSDIEKFASQETFATVFSVQVGCPDELSVPLYTRPAAFDDLVKALEGVIRVADRATDEFDAARAALAKAGVK